MLSTTAPVAPIAPPLGERLRADSLTLAGPGGDLRGRAALRMGPPMSDRADRAVASHPQLIEDAAASPAAHAHGHLTILGALRPLRDLVELVTHRRHSGGDSPPRPEGSLHPGQLGERVGWQTHNGMLACRTTTVRFRRATAPRRDR